MKDKDFNSHTSIHLSSYIIFSLFFMVVILYLFSSVKVFFAHFASFTRYTVTCYRHAILLHQPYRGGLRDNPKGVITYLSYSHLLQTKRTSQRSCPWLKKHSRKHSLSRSFKRTETQQTSFVWLCDWIYSGCDQLIRILWSSNNSLIHIFEGSTDAKWNN